jgi:hypothetical protein
MTSRYVMPFARSCKIQIENRGEREVRLKMQWLPMRYTWENDRSMHFRARWRVDHDLVAEGGGGAQDLPFLVTRGRGVYVGTAIMLLNPNPVPVPYGSWWGEGDEKIFIDDDAVPSTFGTGSEDYFNYSWSVPDIFLYAYCGQPRNDGPANRGFVVNHRWHILDALPFRQQIAFYMELYSHERNPGFSYARIGYHYGRPGLIDDSVRVTDEDVRLLRLPANWQPVARMGARNSTFFQAEEVVRDPDDWSLERGDLWAGGKLLQWRPARPTSQLEFVLPVEEPGKYVLRMTAAQTPASGTLRATLDGEPLAFSTEDKTAPLKTDFRVQLRTFSTGVLELEAGKYQLGLRPADAAQPPAGEPTTFGIDFLWLQKR